MHAGRFAIRIGCMNRHHRLSTLLVMGAVLAACSSPAASTSEPPEPASPAPPMASRLPEAGSSTTASATATPHDMDGMDGGETVTIDIANFAYEPAEIVIAAGTEVVFTNGDSAPHTVTAGTDEDPMPEAFDSGLLEQGDSFSFVFEEPGEFAYFCDRHPPMTGMVVVEG